MTGNIFSASYSETEDHQLIKQALNGSAPALESLIKKHYGYIYNVALRFVLSPADAKDLTQEVALKVVTKLSQFNFQSEFRTWLYTIVFRHFLNTKKRKLENFVTTFEDYGEGLDKIPFSDLSPDEEISLREEVKDAKISCMLGMLLCLDRKQRLIYILGELFEVESSTAGEILEMSPETFRQNLSRARKDLYNFMNNKCGLVNKSNPCRCPKKTKGFIAAGYVNQQDLQFNNNFVRKLREVVIEKSNLCDTIVEEKYAALFKDHPYYNKDASSEIVKKLTGDSLFTDAFNL